MAKTADVQKLDKRLGRHTRLALPFEYRIDGKLVDLEGLGYTARAYVATPDDEEHGPFPCDIDGTQAIYTLRAEDVGQASVRRGRSNVRVTVVAESGNSTLVSDVREIAVGDWPGADGYEPA